MGGRTLGTNAGELHALALDKLQALAHVADLLDAVVRVLFIAGREGLARDDLEQLDQN